MWIFASCPAERNLAAEKTWKLCYRKLGKHYISMLIEFRISRLRVQSYAFFAASDDSNLLSFVLCHGKHFAVHDTVQVALTDDGIGIMALRSQKNRNSCAGADSDNITLLGANWSLAYIPFVRANALPALALRGGHYMEILCLLVESADFPRNLDNRPSLVRR